jgi:host factor-I protein
MAEQRTRLQTVFMDAVETQRTPVSVFLANGVRLQGFLVGEDAYCMLLVNQGRAQLIYKHAISAVLPERPVDLTQGHGTGEGREGAVSDARPPRPSGPRGPGARPSTRR